MNVQQLFPSRRWGICLPNGDIVGPSFATYDEAHRAMAAMKAAGAKGDA